MSDAPEPVAMRDSRPRARLTAAGAAVLFALVALDLLRPYAGASLRPSQWVAGACAVVVLAVWLAARNTPRAEAWPLVGLAALLVPTYVDHSRSIDSDGVHYYSYLRSLLFDGDLDLRNDYQLLGYDEAHRNVLPIGAPLLWSPFLIAVHAARQAARLFGMPPPVGVEPLYAAAVSLATFGLGAAGLFLLYSTLRRFGSPGAALWATVIAWVGSPLRFYLSVIPSMAHGAEFLCAVLVVRAALTLREQATRRAGVWAGAACGLAFLVRSQDGILLGLPALLLVPQLFTPSRRADAWRAAAALLIAFALTALPQAAVWQAMYGTPVLIPHKLLHGDAFMNLQEPQLAGVLLSPRGGVFTSHPALLAASLGLVALLFRDRGYVLSALPVLLAGWYVNATVFDWYQVRRFTGLVPVVAPGLALLLSPLARGLVSPAALLALLALRYDLAVDSLRNQPGQPAPVRAVLEEASDAGVRDVYRILEPWAPVSAVGLVRAYTGRELLREPVSRIELGTADPALRLPLRARHFSEIAAEEGVACRWVSGDIQATLFLPLVFEGEVIITLVARPLDGEAPPTMEALWNDVSSGALPMRAGWSEYRYHVPPEAVRAGTNALVVRFDRAPIYRRVRGTGPREVRPAAIASITLHRSSPTRR